MSTVEEETLSPCKGYSTVSTDLRRIGEKARSDHRLVFTSLYHHVTDVDNLRVCYEALPGDRAVGVDGVSKEQYGEKLEENLQALSQRLKRMRSGLVLEVEPRVCHVQSNECRGGSGLFT